MSGRRVSVVIGSFNRKPFLRLAVESVRPEMVRLAGEIIVVDGGSNDGTLAWLAEQRDVITIVQHNHGTWRGRHVERRSWGYFMNLGFKVAQGKYVCMLSDDCLVVQGAIWNGVAQADGLVAEGRKLGAVAFYWRNWPEQKSYWVGRTFGGKLFVNHGLYVREALKAVDYADEDTYDFYHADGDLCLRMWQSGYECVAASDSFVEHYAGANRAVRQSNLAKQKRDWERYTARWAHLDLDRGSGAVGDWVLRDYVDAYGTAGRFNSISEVRVANIRARWRRGAEVLRRMARRAAGSAP